MRPAQIIDALETIAPCDIDNVCVCVNNGASTNDVQQLFLSNLSDEASSQMNFERHFLLQDRKNPPLIFPFSFAFSFINIVFIIFDIYVHGSSKFYCLIRLERWIESVCIRRMRMCVCVFALVHPLTPNKITVFYDVC